MSQSINRYRVFVDAVAIREVTGEFIVLAENEGEAHSMAVGGDFESVVWIDNHGVIYDDLEIYDKEFGLAVVEKEEYGQLSIFDDDEWDEDAMDNG